jgi:hypothetical protein
MAEISPLCRRMIDDMMVRNLAPATQQPLSLCGGEVQPAFRPLAGPARSGGGSGLPAPPNRSAAFVVAHQSDSVRLAVLLRCHLRPDRRSRTLVAAREPQKLPGC